MTAGHYQQSVLVKAPPYAVVAYVDDHSRFSSHMNESSWMMAGVRMSTSVDERRRQAVGSHIRMAGRVLGVRLSLDEVVTQRVPPRYKEWETVGQPTLVVVGPYRMSVEITPQGQSSRVGIVIDFDHPQGLSSLALSLRRREQQR